jgi:squalene-associated FAD-dependent desaturase
VVSVATVAVVGGGWAGMAAAIHAVRRGWQVTVFEASHRLGGRARGLVLPRPDGLPLDLDNGQHILIGAYTETLSLMEAVGVDPTEALLALPLGLTYPDGTGVRTPTWAQRWPAPLDTLAAIANAPGWSWTDRVRLLRRLHAWRRNGFRGIGAQTVAQLCRGLPPRAMAELIEPLCVSALNLPPDRADGQLFLNVVRDALFGRGHRGMSAARLLLPRCHLSALLPEPAARWLVRHGARVLTGTRVTALRRERDGWALAVCAGGEPSVHVADRVIWATAAGPAAQAMARTASEALPGHEALASSLTAWSRSAADLAHTAIATVYAQAEGGLPHPMLALRPGPAGPAYSAQFVFDRGRLQPGATGVLAFVASACPPERDRVQDAVLAQAREQLGLRHLRPIRTVIERRATFAGTPSLRRPGMAIGPGLLAAGDYVDGPYPATLEGAVRSGARAAANLA